MLFGLYSYAVDSICICDNADVHFLRRLVLLMAVLCSLLMKWLELIGVHDRLALDVILVIIFVVLLWIYGMYQTRLQEDVMCYKNVHYVIKNLWSSSVSLVYI